MTNTEGPGPVDLDEELDELEQEAGVDPTPQQVQEYEDVIEEHSPGAIPASPEPPD
jgi:hypothetical protein